MKRLSHAVIVLGGVPHHVKYRRVVQFTASLGVHAATPVVLRLARGRRILEVNVFSAAVRYRRCEGPCGHRPDARLLCVAVTTLRREHVSNIPLNGCHGLGRLRPVRNDVVEHFVVLGDVLEQSRLVIDRRNLDSIGVPFRLGTFTVQHGLTFEATQLMLQATVVSADLG